jgi:DNA processing protein
VTTDESPVDLIIERSGLPAHVVTANLMKLEMRRLVRAFPGFRYARR